MTYQYTPIETTPHKMLRSNIQISWFKNAHSTDPQTVTLGNFLSNKDCLNQIEAVRAAETKEEKDKLKKALPAATISGVFTARKIEGLAHYNGLVCLDFDAPDNPNATPEQIKQTLSDFDAVAFASLSVGGKGVFAIIPTNLTDPVQHPRICDFLRTVFLKTNLLADPSCKDISRLRFCSYDPAPYHNPAPEIFDAVRFLVDLKEREKEVLRPTSFAAPSDYTRFRVEKHIEAAESGCNDVTDNYLTWLKIGFALASEFGSDGENYYHRISQFHPKYDYQKTALKYAELLRNGSGRVRIGTFFKLLADNGIKL